MEEPSKPEQRMGVIWTNADAYNREASAIQWREWSIAYESSHPNEASKIDQMNHSPETPIFLPVLWEPKVTETETFTL